MTFHPLAASFIMTLTVALFAVSETSAADPLVLDVSKVPAAPKADVYKLGTARNPAGHEITINNLSLLRDGKPWLPVMGEFHYSRYPANEWRDELLKMKAGGITTVATYVFWIHHEEVEGQWDWSGQRNLRDFVKACQDAGLPVIVRMGPWCHGEVRNGGLPEWILPMGRRLRTQDEEFLGKVKILYSQIADQLKGLLWKEGGPVIGLQFDNEYRGRAEYLLALKKIAQDLGLDTPIYTRTGWPNLTSPMPIGEILPLYGAYSEGFWDRGVTAMPGKYWFAFLFSSIRTDTAIGTDVLGERDMRDDPDATSYPFLSCELGGGMMNSYHRRVLIDPRDIESVALVKTGSGSNLPGYYMYHGGTNPQGKLTTLMEAQNTSMTNYNDMPVKNYDFQAPLGEFGQVRPHYHGLRRLHMFLADWGSTLANMPAIFPAGEQRKNDTEKVRWAVRGDGNSGFLFVSNYQRLLAMPAKEGVQFDLKLANGNLRIPSEPFLLPADSYFVWPFNMDLGGVNLVFATAQPVCKFEEADTTHMFFTQNGDIPAEFLFDGVGITFTEPWARKVIEQNQVRYTQIRYTQRTPGLVPPFTVTSANGKKTLIYVLDDETARRCWKGNVGGRDRIFLSKANLMFDGGTLRVQASDPSDMAVAILENGKFNPLHIEPVLAKPVEVALEQIKQAGPLRQIKNGSQRVAEQPSDADFDQAAVWRVKLPAGIDPARNLMLRLKYAGDVARVYLDGKLILDDFYNGNAFDIGLKRYAPDIYGKELLIKILPLQKAAPFYLAKEAIPDFGTSDSALSISKVEVIEQYEVTVPLKGP